MKKFELYEGDCLKIMKQFPDNHFNAIITDLPYGTTSGKWDNIISFEPMWAEVKRITKADGVFVTTASQPFTSKLIMSNIDDFRTEWIWDKVLGTGHLNCKKLPMKRHENVVVFSQSLNGK